MFSIPFLPPPLFAPANATILFWSPWSPAALFVIVVEVLFVIGGCAVLWRLSRPEGRRHDSPDPPVRMPEPLRSREKRAA